MPPSRNPVVLTGSRAPKKEVPMPPVTTVVRNAAVAAVRNGVQAVKSAIKKEKFLVPDHVEAERKGKCDACPWFNAQRDRCGHFKCGCYLRVKTRLVAEKCPDGRW